MPVALIDLPPHVVDRASSIAEALADSAVPAVPRIRKVYFYAPHLRTFRVEMALCVQGSFIVEDSDGSASMSSCAFSLHPH